MHRWPLGCADAGDRDRLRGIAGALPGLRSGPAAGRAVAFGWRERQPFMRAGSSAAGAMSEWPGSVAEARVGSKPGGALIETIARSIAPAAR